MLSGMKRHEIGSFIHIDSCEYLTADREGLRNEMNGIEVATNDFSNES
jgi:hypothetical protein